MRVNGQMAEEPEKHLRCSLARSETESFPNQVERIRDVQTFKSAEPGLEQARVKHRRLNHVVRQKSRRDSTRINNPPFSHLFEMAEEPAVDKRSDREGQEGLVGKSSCRVSLEAPVRSREPIHSRRGEPSPQR